ncbi:MAG: hypothetical protein HKN20_08925 [Gemmatimonadetes bacterium]|nr:hypothetical protein [Gemmatimonadota bacterium]
MTGRSRAFATYAAGTLLFVLFFQLTVRSIGNAFPSTDTTLFDEKLGELSESAVPHDVIFVGSSRVYRHVHPATFDSVLAAHDIIVHSYNLGSPGTNAFETPSQIRTILERDREDRIRWVFVALEGLEWNMEEMNLASDRVSRYFDWRTFLRAARLLRANETLANEDRRRALLDRVPPLFRNMTAYARGGNWLREQIEPGRSHASPLLARHENGFQSLDTAYAYSEGTVRASLDERIETYERNREKRALRKRARGGRDSTEVSHQASVLRDLLREIEEIVRAHGAEVVYFERNFGSGAPDLEAMKQEGVIDHLISLEDPARYPVLHDESHRFDGGHYDEEGAKLLTRYLAEAFVPIARGKGGGL